MSNEIGRPAGVHDVDLESFWKYEVMGNAGMEVTREQLEKEKEDKEKSIEVQKQLQESRQPMIAGDQQRVREMEEEINQRKKTYEKQRNKMEASKAAIEQRMAHTEGLNQQSNAKIAEDKDALGKIENDMRLISLIK